MDFRVSGGPSILFRPTGQRHSLFVHIWLIGHWVACGSVFDAEFRKTGRLKLCGRGDKLHRNMGIVGVFRATGAAPILSG